MVETSLSRLVLASVFAVLSLSSCGTSPTNLRSAATAYTSGDYETAFEQLRSLAQTGNVRAQYLLGLMFNEGKGVQEDDAEAFHWFRKAALHNNADANLALALMYFNGDGVQRNLAGAKCLSFELG